MRPLVVSGSAHPSLAAEIAREVECELAPCLVQRFPDGEQELEIQASVRGQVLFIVQPLGASVGENLLELLLLADACRRAGAATIAAIVPYVGFARQDRVLKEGQPLGAKVVAQALGTGGFSQILAVDLHSPVVASCIDAPVVHLTAVPALAAALRPHVHDGWVVVAPDLGAVKLAEAYARSLGLPMALVSKVRTAPTEVTVRSVVGDVRGKRPIIVDDMISTGTTVDAAIEALLAHGCRPGEIMVTATHGLFVGGAKARLDRPDVARIFASDSVPPPDPAPGRLQIVRLAPLLAEAVRRIAGERSLNDLLSER